MIVEIRSSFQKDAKKLPSPVQIELFDIIENLQSVASLTEIRNCKKLTGFKNAYRIRIKEYRIGFSSLIKKLNW